MQIGVIIQEGSLGSAIATIVDILSVAEMVRPEIDASIPSIDVCRLAHRRRVRTSGGMTITADRGIRDTADLDVLVVPAAGTFTAATTEAMLTSASGVATVRTLALIDPSRIQIAAACTGVFPLAESGLIDDRRVTTAWFLSSAFRRRYPSVDLELDSMVVADGPFLTAGAAFAHIDLALALVRSVSSDLATQVSRLLLIDERSSQVSYIAYDQLGHEDAIVLAFERYVRSHLREPFDVSVVARAIGTSRRTLERRTQAAVGSSPLGIVQRLRIERAQHLRRTTALSTDQVAHQVGYSNAETLRALQRRLL